MRAMQTVDQIVEQLASGDAAAGYRARRSLEQLTASVGAPGATGRAEVAARLAEHLLATQEGTQNPRYSAEVRGVLARALGNIGGEAEVAALKAALADFDVRENARFGLQRIPGEASLEALAEAAVQAVGSEFRIGVLGALGLRGGPKAIEALRACAADEDPEVALAALEALAHHADASSDALFAQAAEKAGRRFRARIERARLRLAESLQNAGQTEAARGIYRALADTASDEAQRAAAQAALERLS
jgi:HEAT repeat protein